MKRFKAVVVLRLHYCPEVDAKDDGMVAMQQRCVKPTGIAEDVLVREAAGSRQPEWRRIRTRTCSRPHRDLDSPTAPHTLLNQVCPRPEYNPHEPVFAIGGSTSFRTLTMLHSTKMLMLGTDVRLTIGISSLRRMRGELARPVMPPLRMNLRHR